MFNFDQVYNLYRKFGFIPDEWQSPHLIPQKDAIVKLNSLHEEIHELSEAYNENDLSKIADGLVDLVVFALGTAAMHHLPWEEIFKEVMRANSDKQVGILHKERNGPDGGIDLIKPEGWKPPDIESILKDWGWVPPSE